MSPRILYEEELDKLSESLELMCAQVEHFYGRLFEAVDQKDTETIKLIIKNDSVINDMERDIESKCLMIITRQQPLASDLRFVSSALKVVTDLERVGDHVADMAELLIKLEFKEFDQYSVHLPQMIIDTKNMIHDAVDAFISRNSEAAKKVIMEDEIIDAFFEKVETDLISHIRDNSQDADECIDILMIAKYLEKMGDHAVNIGDWTIFRETGVLQDKRIL